MNLCTGSLVFSNAAHPPPILQRADGDLEFLDKGGSIIGLSGALPFEEGETALLPGDRLFLYTDGIPEYRTQDGEFFGTERFLELVKGSRSLPLKKALSGIMADILTFGGDNPPQDDVSLLSFEYSPK